MTAPDRTPTGSVVLVYPAIGPAGGIERFVLEVASRLTGRFDVTVAASGGREHLPAGCRWIGIPASRGPAFLRSLGFAVLATRRLREEGGVVNAQGATHFSADVVTAHSCHRTWYRRSLDETTTLSWPWIRKLLNPLHPVILAIEAIQYRRARAVLAVSEGVKREIVEAYGVPPERIAVCYGGVDRERFRPAGPDGKARLRRERGVDPDGLVCLFVSNEFRRKGLRVLLEAVARTGASDLSVVVVGRDRAAPYRALARRLGLGGRVRFTGPTDDPSPWYRLADLFVLPTLYEPFGLVVAEALASGLPVVTSARAGVAELLEDGRDALLLDDPRDPEELTRALTRLLDPGERTRVAGGAREVSGRFTWDRVADRVAAALAGVVAGEPRAGPGGSTP